MEIIWSSSGSPQFFGPTPASISAMIPLLHRALTPCCIIIIITCFWSLSLSPLSLSHSINDNDANLSLLPRSLPIPQDKITGWWPLSLHFGCSLKDENDSLQISLIATLSSPLTPHSFSTSSYLVITGRREEEGGDLSKINATYNANDWPKDNDSVQSESHPLEQQLCPGDLLPLLCSFLVAKSVLFS